MGENLWSTLQELLDRRRAVTATYLPLYLAEHLCRYNHRSEPTLEQLRTFIRNAHDVVLRGDDKPCDARQIERTLAVQLALHPPSPKAKKARNKEQRSRSDSNRAIVQQRIEGL